MLKELHQKESRPSGGVSRLSRVKFISSNQTCRNKTVNSGCCEDTSVQLQPQNPPRPVPFPGLANLNFFDLYVNGDK